jgi:isochorismate hydrolase
MWLVRRRKVKDTDYPYAGPALSAKERPQVRRDQSSPRRAVSGSCRACSCITDTLSAYAQDIFVFVVGGATYEEARSVALLNAANKHQRIVLGGTCMLSSAAFLRDLEKAAAAAA